VTTRIQRQPQLTSKSSRQCQIKQRVIRCQHQKNTVKNCEECWIGRVGPPGLTEPKVGLDRPGQPGLFETFCSGVSVFGALGDRALPIAPCQVGSDRRGRPGLFETFCFGDSASGAPSGHALPSGAPSGHTLPSGAPSGHALPSGAPSGRALPSGALGDRALPCALSDCRDIIFIITCFILFNVIYIVRSIWNGLNANIFRIACRSGSIPNTKFTSSPYAVVPRDEINWRIPM